MSGILLSYDWTGATIEADDGTNPAETFTFDTECGWPSGTLWQVIGAYVDWFNDAGRAWTGVITAARSLATSGDYGMAVTITYTGGTVDHTTSTVIETYALLENGEGAQSSYSSSGPVLVGASGEWRLREWYDQPTGHGAHGHNGAWMMSGGATTGDAKRPRIVGVLNEAEALAFGHALRLMASPRLATVWDSINETWRTITLGRVRMRQEGSSHLRVTLEAMA